MIRKSRDKHIHIILYKIDKQYGFTVQHTELCSISYNNISESLAVQLKLTQNCKSTILQLKKKERLTMILELPAMNKNCLYILQHTKYFTVPTYLFSQ